MKNPEIKVSFSADNVLLDVSSFLKLSLSKEEAVQIAISALDAVDSLLAALPSKDKDIALLKMQKHFSRKHQA